jgi:hypothetical protein
MSKRFARSNHRFTVPFAALTLLAAIGCGGSGSTASVDPSGSALKGGIPANGKSNGHGQGAQAGSASVEHGQGNGHAAAGHGNAAEHGPQAGHGQGNGAEHGPQAGHGNSNGHAHAQAGDGADDTDDQADEM